ncbi:GntR family transcriptional regulator [Catenulispora sp. NF23]|uniref:GntR family transcriptional regulator n=1 Tax=Catenulispora pinistramenti TaxID=2705254 RepID=UPI001BA94114|nr:GntR family transcriptional regulator [Catenulispora pinistramenti]MBS2538804.1 GntR family transcriptional regulator [Catenulispora pinistramenti]
MATKYERAANDLRRRIRSGEWGPGEQLPAETTLAAHYGVNVTTLRNAIRVLKVEGLVESIHGKGNFVRAPRTLIERSPERYQWEKDRARLSEAERIGTGATEKDTGLRFEDLEFYAKYDDIVATNELSEVFGVPLGTKMLRRTFRTSSRHEDAPISLVTSYLVHAVVARNPALLDERNEPWPGGTQSQLWTIGIEVGSITDRIRTRPPSADEAEDLGIDPEGVATFVLQKISKDTEGQVVEVSTVVLPGDRTEFVNTTKLTPWETK